MHFYKYNPVNTIPTSVSSIFMYTQVMVWQLVLGIFNVCIDFGADDCTWGWGGGGGMDTVTVRLRKSAQEVDSRTGSESFGFATLGT